MKIRDKILISLLILLFITIVGEIGYYFFYQPRFSNIQKKPTDIQLSESLISPTSIKISTLSKEDIKILEDPYYWSFLPLSYDSEKNLIYIHLRPKVFMDFRKNMGINYASWVSIATYTKGQTESLTLQEKLKGTISELDANKIINGKRYLYLKLIGKDGISSIYKDREDTANKIKFVRLIKGQEVPINWEKDLKNGDQILIDGSADLTKAPSDPNFVIASKITILE